MGFPGGLAVKNSPAMQETRVDVGAIPGSGRSTGGGNGNQLHILATKIPWTEEPDRLKPIGSQRIGQDRTEQERKQSFYKALEECEVRGHLPHPC